MSGYLTERALRELYRLIGRGIEFPDACWTVAHQMNLRVDTLRDAYDAAEVIAGEIVDGVIKARTEV